MLDVLRQDGQPREDGWTYTGTSPANPSTWAPPSDIGEVFHADGTRVASPDLAAIRATIDGGEPVVMVITLSDAFFNSAIDADGVIDSTEPLDPKRVHAVVAVAHGTRGGEPVTLVRNSWGMYWGVDGHAWLTDRYLHSRLLEWAKLRKVI